MKNLFKNIMSALATLLVVACASSDTTEPENRIEGMNALHFTATKGTASTIRALTDVQTSVFDADELIRGYIWHDEQTYNDVMITTMEPVETAPTVNPLHTDKTLIGPADREKTVSLYALYPSWLTSATTKFTVSADQRLDGDASAEQGEGTVEAWDRKRGYKGSDLMFGSRTNVTQEESPVLITFTHKMAKIVVKAKSDRSVSGLIITGVKVKNVNRTIGFTGITGELGSESTLDDVSDILMTNNGACLLPPKQTIAANTDFIEVSTTYKKADGTSASGNAMFQVGTELTLKEGHQYTFTLDIGTKALTLRAVNTILSWTDDGGQEDVIPLADGEFAIKPITEEFTYDATDHHPDITVLTAQGKILSTDAVFSSNFDIQYIGCTNAGEGLVLVTGKSGTSYYGGVASQTFTIHPKDITPFVADIPAVDYSGAAQSAVIAVTDTELGELNAIEHYSMSGNGTEPQSEAGTYTVTFEGKGNYTGTIAKEFVIKKVAAELYFKDGDIAYNNPSGYTGHIFLGNALSGSTGKATVTFRGGELAITSNTLSATYATVALGTDVYDKTIAPKNEEVSNAIGLTRNSDIPFYGTVTLTLTVDANHYADVSDDTKTTLTKTFDMAGATTLAKSRIGDVVTSGNNSYAWSTKNNENMFTPNTVFSALGKSRYAMVASKNGTSGKLFPLSDTGNGNYSGSHWGASINGISAHIPSNNEFRGVISACGGISEFQRKLEYAGGNMLINGGNWENGGYGCSDETGEEHGHRVLYFRGSGYSWSGPYELSFKNWSRRYRDIYNF